MIYNSVTFAIVTLRHSILHFQQQINCAIEVSFKVSSALTSSGFYYWFYLLRFEQKFQPVLHVKIFQVSSDM